MGVMVDGRWTTEAEASKLKHEDGRWIRPRSSIRHWITPDGSPGPTGDGGFEAEPGRYHLFVAYGCPWAHRTLLFRVLKGLTGAITVSVALPRRSEDGWIFADEPGQHYESCLGKHALWEVYAEAHAGFTGRVTVPLLYDKKTGRAVNNESADIIRMLNGGFNEAGANAADYYPPELRGEIDALNARIYEKLNNGVYRAGFAETQDAYEEGFDDVFATLDFLEERLARRRYLCGARQTESDWRLFPTLARFDVAYHYAFKCNLRRIMDYPNLWPYTRDLYQTPGIAATVFPEVYKQGYFSISELRNPLGIVPKGPEIDFSEPQDRSNLNAG
jgi:putative glutathione S-transferase